MGTEIYTPIVSADWLHEHWQNNAVRIVDASWHLPAALRDARAEFAEAHIPGAVFFDIDEHAAQSQLPHMLPDARQFAQAASALGIAADDHIIVYDTVGLFSAARVWWMFRHFGAERVSVLDGGLPAWKRMGGQLRASHDSAAGNTPADPERQTPTEFIVSTGLQRQYVMVDTDTVLSKLDAGDTLILDARSHSRFTGEEKEARQGLRSGHIPGSVNLPFLSLLDDQGLLKPACELRQMFDALSIDSHSNIITSCGSGVTAAVLCLAIECVGYGTPSIYDGSWSEWGANPALPVATQD